MKPNPVTSLFVRIKINIERIIDILWRNLTGIPIIRYTQITPHLYLGGQYGLNALPWLKKLNINAVVNMRESQIHKPDQFKWLTVLNLPTVDWTAPTIENLDKGSKFITEILKKGGGVYIHCHAGLGRGPSMAIAYLMSTGMTFDDAFAEVKKVRPFITPTREQIIRLRDFEKFLKKKI